MQNGKRSGTPVYRPVLKNINAANRLSKRTPLNLFASHAANAARQMSLVGSKKAVILPPGVCVSFSLCFQVRASLCRTLRCFFLVFDEWSGRDVVSVSAVQSSAAAEKVPTRMTPNQRRRRRHTIHRKEKNTRRNTRRKVRTTHAAKDTLRERSRLMCCIRVVAAVGRTAPAHGTAQLPLTHQPFNSYIILPGVTL